MKKTKLILTTFIFTMISITNVSAQKFDVPQNLELKTADDYAKYEPSIVAAAKWLDNTDLDQQADKRKEINEFVTNWGTGNPKITIEINPELTKIFGKNDQLLPIYLANYSRFLILHKNGTTLQAIEAGLGATMDVYGKGVLIKKNPEMTKLIQAANNDKFDDFVKKYFKTT